MIEVSFLLFVISLLYTHPHKEASKKKQLRSNNRGIWGLRSGCVQWPVEYFHFFYFFCCMHTNTLMPKAVNPYFLGAQPNLIETLHKFHSNFQGKFFIKECRLLFLVGGNN